MDGIIVVNKPKGLTSRDVVNKICKIFNTKKVGHTGTLDPLATGVLIICIGKATKLVEILTSHEKEYIASVKLGLLTDTLDTDGNIIKKEDISLDKEKLISVVNSFKKEYMQEVPIYSAVKINGKKLYEYARENKVVELPSRLVNIKNIELLDYEKNSSYKFKALVSKGTYIRSLINDINNELNIIGVMSELIRTKQGKYKLEDSYTLEDIENNNFKLFSITDVLKDDNCVIINSKTFEKIRNGAILNNIYDKEIVTFIYNEEVIAIYKTYDKDSTKLKPFKMFI